MPNILCPKCNSTLAIADESVGQMVQCGSCQQVFKAVPIPPPSKRPAAEEDDDEDEDERPSRRKKRKRYRDDEDEDDPPPAGTNGMATASLVLGILALVIELPSFGGTVFSAACCVICSFLFWPGHGLAVVLAVIGGLLGLLSMKNPIGKGSRIAGLILCGVTILLAILSIALNLLGIAAAGAMPMGPVAQPTRNINGGFPQGPINPPPPKPNLPRR